MTFPALSVFIRFRRLAPFLLVAGWLDMGAAAAPASNTPPFRVMLDWVSGRPDQPSLLELRLAPPVMRRAGRSGSDTNPAPVFEAQTPASWADAIEWRRRDTPDSEERGWASGLKLAGAPRESRLRFGSNAMYRIAFLADPASAPAAGAAIRARVILGGATAESAPLIVPPPSADRTEAALDSVAIAVRAGDAALALKIADDWIAKEPDRHEGYWCRGQALEAQGNRAAALEAYRSALHRFPKRDAVGSRWEPPIVIQRRIDRLSKP